MDELNDMLGTLLTITCFTGLELLAAKFWSPPYWATTSLVPTARLEVVRVAVPPAKIPVPRTIGPVLNVIVSPSGGPTVLELIAAVKTTAWPNDEGFGAEVIVVVVAA
jgi:hypothetical protein